jgi:hypothetical protein
MRKVGSAQCNKWSKWGGVILRVKLPEEPKPLNAAAGLYTNATGPSWPMLRETPKSDTPDQYPPRRRHTSQKAEMPPPIHLLAVVAANDNVIMIRVELLTIYLVDKIVFHLAIPGVAGAAQASVSACFHDVCHITSQVPAAWRNAAVVVVTQPDCVAVLARNAGTTIGANSAVTVETFQVFILMLIKLI